MEGDRALPLGGWRRSGWEVTLHASATCLRVRDLLRCALLVGGSGAGKSTLAELSRRHGMLPIADDFVKVDHNFTIYSIDKFPVYKPKVGILDLIFVLVKRDIDPITNLFLVFLETNDLNFRNWLAFHEIVWRMREKIRILRTDLLSEEESILEVRKSMRDALETETGFGD